MTIRRSGVKLYLSLITAPIVLALIINLLTRRCNVNRIVILQIRSAMPIQDINTSVPILALWIFISWIGKADRRETGLVLLAKAPTHLKLKLKLIGCTNLRIWFQPQIKRMDCKWKHCMYLHFIFSSPIGGAKNSQRFAYWSRQCLFKKL
jgi:hypothetical protein